MSNPEAHVQTVLQAWFLLNLRLCNSDKSEIAWTFHDHAAQIGPKTTLVVDLESIDKQTTIEEVFAAALNSSASDLDVVLACPQDAKIHLTTSVLAQLFSSTDNGVSTSAGAPGACTDISRTRLHSKSFRAGTALA
jgi:hypothetical protein